MQVSFPVAVSCLHVLLTLFKPVRSTIMISDSSAHGIIVEENKPFTLWCTAKDSDNKDISGSFKWKRDKNLDDHQKISVDNSDPDVNITEQISRDKKSITSILTVRKPPRLFAGAFYYICTFDTDKASQQLPITVIEDGQIPHVSIGNKTNSNVSSIVASFGEEVELVCLLSKKIAEQNSAQLTLTWKKGKEKSALKKHTFSKKQSSSLKSFIFEITVNVKSSDDGGVYFCQSHYSYKGGIFNSTSSVEFRIIPIINGDSVKEVKQVAGKDVKLHCDIVGYPLKYEWQFEDGTKIPTGGRYSTVSPTVLAIDDITYDDRKKYICVGNYSNGEKTIKQTIILRVKDPLAPLWPFIGIVIEVIVVAVIILGTEHYQKKKKNTETDGGDESIDNDPASTTYN